MKTTLKLFLAVILGFATTTLLLLVLLALWGKSLLIETKPAQFAALACAIPAFAIVNYAWERDAIRKVRMQQALIVTTWAVVVCLTLGNYLVSLWEFGWVPLWKSYWVTLLELSVAVAIFYFAKRILHGQKQI